MCCYCVSYGLDFWLFDCVVLLRMKRASSLNFLNKSTEETTQVRSIKIQLTNSLQMK